MSEKNKLTIGYLPILDHLILGVAANNDQEIFKDLGIQSRQFKNWDEIAEALASGEIEAAFLLFPLALKLFREGFASKVLLLGHREGQSLIVRDSIKTVGELRGKTIFVPHQYSTHLILLQKLLQGAGLSVNDVKLVIGDKKLTSVAQKFAKGEIDAVIIAEPMCTEMVRQKGSHALVLSKEIEQHHVDCILVARDNVLKEASATLQTLIERLVRAGGFINSYPRQSAEIGSAFLGWPKDLLLEALTHDNGHILFWDLLPRLEDFEALQKSAVKHLSLWEKEVDLAGFVDASFAQSAYREWVIDGRREVKDRGADRSVPGNFPDAARSILSALVGRVNIAGVKYIRSGQRYPKAVARVPFPDKGAEAVAQLVEGGGGGVFESPQAGLKAVFVSTEQEEMGLPDHAVLLVNPDQGQRCFYALTFGEQQKMRLQDAERLFTDEPFSFVPSNGQILLRISFPVFRLLGILLKQFKKEQA